MGMGQTDRQTDIQTDRQTDRQTDGSQHCLRLPTVGRDIIYYV